MVWGRASKKKKTPFLPFVRAVLAADELPVAVCEFVEEAEPKGGWLGCAGRKRPTPKPGRGAWGGREKRAKVRWKLEGINL